MTLDNATVVFFIECGSYGKKGIRIVLPSLIISDFVKEDTLKTIFKESLLLLTLPNSINSVSYRYRTV